MVGDDRGQATPVVAAVVVLAAVVALALARAGGVAVDGARARTAADAAALAGAAEGRAAAGDAGRPPTAARLVATPSSAPTSVVRVRVGSVHGTGPGPPRQGVRSTRSLTAEAGTVVPYTRDDAPRALHPDAPRRAPCRAPGARRSRSRPIRRPGPHRS